ncbi:MAG: glycosyltransferase family 1 protein, partial [Thermoprotei archaeon]
METLRILWMNWKCIKHPEAGGAEIYTHEVAKRLVKMGHEVTLLTSSFPGAKSKEIIDGYTVLRAGNRFTVYIRAREIYEKMFKGKVDVVIDEINTLPFFTVKYVRENVVALIHQLAREYWFYETPLPLSILGYFLEPRYLKLYRKYPTITVSNSTKEDLKRLGFENIHVVPPGVSLKPLSSIPAKNKEPTIIFIGRLKKAKRPQHVIK